MARVFFVWILKKKICQCCTKEKDAWSSWIMVLRWPAAVLLAQDLKLGALFRTARVCATPGKWEQEGTEWCGSVHRGRQVGIQGLFEQLVTCVGCR